MECTSCQYCLVFGKNYRIFCQNEGLESTEVVKYGPINKVGNAIDCVGFSQGKPQQFTRQDYHKAQEYSDQVFGDLTSEGVFEWVKTR